MLTLVKSRQTIAEFGEFWELFPRRVGKKDARHAFDRIRWTPELWEEVKAAIQNWSRSEQWLKDGGAFIPYPSTWLRGERWEDEMDVSIKVTYCKWRGCTKPATTVLNGSDLCEGHNQARKRGESPV